MDNYYFIKIEELLKSRSVWYTTCYEYEKDIPAQKIKKAKEVWIPRQDGKPLGPQSAKKEKRKRREEPYSLE